MKMDEVMKMDIMELDLFLMDESMTKRDLASCLNISCQHLWRLKTGRSQPSPKLEKKLQFLTKGRVKNFRQTANLDEATAAYKRKATKCIPSKTEIDVMVTAFEKALRKGTVIRTVSRKEKNTMVPNAFVVFVERED